MENTNTYKNNQTSQTMQITNHLPNHYDTKIQMVDTFIRAGIAYSFYAVSYSLPAIKKLD